jgi:hypothetical protein
VSSGTKRHVLRHSNGLSKTEKPPRHGKLVHPALSVIDLLMTYSDVP